MSVMFVGDVWFVLSLFVLILLSQRVPLVVPVVAPLVPPLVAPLAPAAFNPPSFCVRFQQQTFPDSDDDMSDDDMDCVDVSAAAALMVVMEKVRC